MLDGAAHGVIGVGLASGWHCSAVSPRAKKKRNQRIRTETFACAAGLSIRS